MTLPDAIRLTDILPALAAATGLDRAALGERLAAALEDLPEPISDEVWVGADSLRPVPRRRWVRVSRADLVCHFRTGIVQFSRRYWRLDDDGVIGPVRIRTWTDEPSSGEWLVWGADAVFVSTGWLRRLLERAALPDAWNVLHVAGFIRPGSLAQPDIEAPPAELSVPEQRLRRIEEWLLASGRDPQAVKRGDKVKAKKALMAEGMADHGFDHAWQYGRNLGRIRDAPRKLDVA